eukprot:TRINITY_DN5221_c0_g4_i1.p1 TRINITY_DN5221_c0_g4~~TRINITY_DN5221_c0_g4_i1.p1  ORF type:complete len:119 (+),score=2.09 TRINITY_DN5221_c0_g4_i1:426-782(+)
MNLVHFANPSLSTLANKPSLILGFEILVGLFLVAGGFVCSKLGVQPPGIYSFLRKNIVIVIVILYFGCNYLRNCLARTRAFEVYLEQALIASRLQSGNIVKVQELIQIVKFRIINRRA